MNLNKPNTQGASAQQAQPDLSDDHLMLVEVFDQPAGSRFQFLHPSDLAQLSTGHRVIYHADVDPNALFKLTSDANGDCVSQRTTDFDIRTFLENASALTRSASQPNGEAGVSSSNPDQPEANGREFAIASKAMDKATDAFFDLMENNIDRWTYDASSSMLSAIAQFPESDSTLSKRREAADIQVKSNFLNTEFRAFFIESLVCFNCNESIDPTQGDIELELASSDQWREQNMQPLLAKQYDGATKIEYSQLNRRLNHLLDRVVHPNESILGPSAIAWTLAQALAACNFSDRQRSVLEPIILADFNSALEKLYRHINLIWIGLDILPDTKLEIVNTDQN